MESVENLDCIDSVWEQYKSEKYGQMEKSALKSFVKNMIREMGDKNEFTDEDFESCCKQLGYSPHKVLFSKEDFVRFIKNVVTYQ